MRLYGSAARVAGGWAAAAALAAAAFLPGKGPARGDDEPISVPAGKPTPPTRPDEGDLVLAARAASRGIDREVEKAWAAEGLKSAGPADDAEFFRRVSLDVAGVVPTEDEVRAFLSAKDPDKREAKVEELLHSPLFGDHFADDWGRVVFSRIRRYRAQDREVVHDWLADLFNGGRGLDALAREVITAAGNTNDNPALAFTLRFQDGGIPADIAGTTSRVFLGVQIQCAQCHNHPYERWTMQDFAGLASFFNLVQPRRVDPMDPRSGFVVEDPTPQLLARRGRRAGGVGADIKGAADAEPKFLGGATWKDRADTPRRGALADWITSRENPWFAKAMVNRAWSWFFGRGLVNPVDDFRSDNPPTHPELLSSLALGLAESVYDLRYLVRAIVNSRTYRQTSRAPAAALADAAALRRADMFYARGPVKPLTADQAFDSILRATGLDDVTRRSNRAELQRLKAGLLQQFVTTIGDDEMDESEQWAGTIPQGLLLMNGPLTQMGTRSGGPRGREDRMGVVARFNALSAILGQAKEDPVRVRRVYLAALGRYPTEEESSRALGFAGRGKGTTGWEDLFWALLNSSEFMSNH